MLQIVTDDAAAVFCRHYTADGRRIEKQQPTVPVTHRLPVFEQTQLCSLFNWDVSLNVGKRGGDAAVRRVFVSPPVTALRVSMQAHKVKLLAGNVPVLKSIANDRRVCGVWFRETGKFKNPIFTRAQLLSEQRFLVFVNSLLELCFPARTRSQPKAPVARRFQREAKTPVFFCRHNTGPLMELC